MKLNNSSTIFRKETIAKIEEKYNAKYVLETCLADSKGNWYNFPVALFYTEKAHPEGSNYFAMYEANGEYLITDGITAVKDVVYTGIINDGVVEYSRYRHDFRMFGENFIDGGRDYLRVGGNLNNTVEFKIHEGKVLFL